MESSFSPAGRGVGGCGEPGKGVYILLLLQVAQSWGCREDSEAQNQQATLSLSLWAIPICSATCWLICEIRVAEALNVPGFGWSQTRYLSASPRHVLGGQVPESYSGATECQKRDGRGTSILLGCQLRVDASLLGFWKAVPNLFHNGNPFSALSADSHCRLGKRGEC